MAQRKRKEYVYLFICTSQKIDGMYPAKYGCSKSNVKARLYYAQSRMKCKFDIQIEIRVKNAHKAEGEVKWNWRNEIGQMYYMGSEFVGINPDNLEQAIADFKELVDGK